MMLLIIRAVRKLVNCDQTSNTLGVPRFGPNPPASVNWLRLPNPLNWVMVWSPVTNFG